MMKAIWTKPRAEVEQFMANEYVAACGDEHRKYKFLCDAPAGTLYMYDNLSARNDPPAKWPTNKFWGYEYTAADELGSYHPCGKTHEAPTKGQYYWGFVDYDDDGMHDSDETVIVWRGESGWNGHATAQLDMDSWQTSKS